MTYWLVHKSPVYYGWVVMCVATLGLIMTSPGQSYVVSVFIEHFIADLGISRTLVSSIFTGATLVGSLALTMVGRQIDRFGARKVVTLVSAAFGLSCLFMGSVQNALMLGVGFIGLRFLGQSSLGLVSVNVINQWWISRRGLVMGISGLLVALFGLGLFPIIVNQLIPILGWRQTYVLLGLVLLGAMTPLGFIFFRDKPEQFGLLPDGHRSEALRKEVPADIVEEENWTLPEAIRTPAFWMVGGSAGILSMLMTGLIFHLVSVFGDQGLDANAAASVFIPLAIAMAIVNLLGGMLADYIPTRLILIMALLCQSASLYLAMHLSGYGLVLAFGVALGITSGLYRVVMSVVWANYFGRLHLGSITGVAQTIAIGGAALGPMPFGIARDLLGSYDDVLLWSAALPLAYGIANAFVGRPVKRT